MEAILASSLAKVTSTASLAKASGAVSGSVLVGLKSMPKAAAAIIGGVVAVAAVPVVLGTMGFTGAGIAASSLAAKMMSVAAIANGGGVAAGSLVATLQSVGAAGLSMPSKIFLGSVGSALASLMV
ncbi:interferon alpha-inducible protein 27, mitochondrial isoform X2 [Desmodus rotundus]|uniref:interferon alpha-inducible protein 27, mitochondrial isoform X2 n=1 Tax=Desmodus rotundus TaxID=9430 RepID=UPI002381828D|nr:interferon alpha-inducible protein 27-like protein 2 isoform X2 [Desmodus rotundus]